MTTKPTLEQLIAAVKQTVSKQAKHKHLVQAQAKTRHEELGNLEWNLDDSRYWRVIEVLHYYERQVCDCCGEERFTFAYELVGFLQVRVPHAKRWRNGRGEALTPDLLPITQIYDRCVPRCWTCCTVDRCLEDLWHKSPAS